MSEIEQIELLFLQWSHERDTLPHPAGFPNDVLRQIAEVIDNVKGEVAALGLDPYDDFKDMEDHAESALLKVILGNDDFIETLTTDYMTGSRYANDVKVNILAARIMSAAMMGINARAYFKDVDESLIETLYRWAIADVEPLTTYAIEILSYGEQLCSRYQKSNMEMVKLLLKKLQNAHTVAKYEWMSRNNNGGSYAGPCAPWHEDSCGPSDPSQPLHAPRSSLVTPELVGSGDFEQFQVQAVLHFLFSLGEYQEFFGLIMQNNIPKLLLSYISITDIKNPIIFDIINYLSSLLCHKKFASDFMHYDGLQLLLSLPYNPRAVASISTCLYALVFHSSAIERLCCLGQGLIEPLISLCLKLIVGPHESGRSHATLFLSFAFSYQLILEEFDKQHGLKVLIDMLSDSDMLRADPPTTDIIVFLLRQKIKHCCMAINKYFASHTMILAERLRRSKDQQGVGMSPQIHTLANKALDIENIGAAIDVIQAYAEYDLIWKAHDDMNRMGGFEVLLQVLAISTASQTWRSSRNDVMSCVLNVLTLLSILPRYQLKLTEQFTTPGAETHTCVKLVLSAAEGAVLNDVDIQRSALHLIIAVVCGPYRSNANSLTLTPTGPTLATRRSSSDEVMHKMWAAIRTNNGIKVLMSLLLAKTPLFHADEIRMLACKALNGLCRSRGVRQIASKLHLMSSGQLLALMREPVLQENTEIHAKFCGYTSSLLEVLFGVSATQTTTEPSLLNKMTKEDIVAKTPVTYQKEEIYHLLYSTLLDHGLKSSASALAAEVQNKMNKDVTARGPNKQLSVLNSSLPLSPITPCKKITIKNARSRCTSSNEESPLAKPSVPKIPRKSVGMIDYLTSLEIKSSSQAYQPPTLDDLVHNFMRDQHMQCEHPMSIVPPFSLFRGHKCPDPEPRRYEAPVNMVMRLASKQRNPPTGGLYGRYRDYKYVFSKFKPHDTLRPEDRGDSELDEVCFTSCLLAPSNHIIAGYNTGQIKVYEMKSNYTPSTCVYATPPSTDYTDCDPVCGLTLSPSGRFVISSTPSSSSDTESKSTLWNMGDKPFVLEHRHELMGVHHTMFGHRNDDYILGTLDQKAIVYDTYTGKVAYTMVNPHGSSSYYKNHAVFNTTDDLVLNDGVLWDYRAPVAIHKFDKFNNLISGVFSPSGIEIIINSEVWDLRSFKLLRTVSAFDNCLLKFNKSGDVMYGVSPVKREIHDMAAPDMYRRVLGPFESAFRTFDSKSYQSLGTYDVRRQIVDISLDSTDSILATVESPDEDFMPMCAGGTFIRIYNIGRCRNTRGDEEDDDNDEGSDMDEDDDEDDEDDDGDDSLDGPDFMAHEMDSGSDLDEEDEELDEDELTDDEEQLFEMQTDHDSAEDEDSSGQIVAP